MQICPQCGAHYDGGETVCAKDGSTLVHVRPSQAIKVDPLLGRRIKDTYLVQARIGAGGMGTVYRAIQERLGRKVALKVLPQHMAESEEAVLRFHREAQTASSLCHPNTIVIYDYGQEPDGLLYLAMEFVDGRPLTALIREGNLAPRRIFKILEQVGGSLMEAHAAGMIHRDLKPDNIMLTHRHGEDDFVKVLDFGLAKAVRAEGEIGSTITQGNVVLGTPAYMSPEQIQNLPLGPTSDQYALGIIAFEMVTGQAPFQGNTSLSICMQHVSNAPPLMHDIYPNLPLHPQLEAVIRRALAKEPTERFGSVAEFIKEIEPFLQGEEWRSGSSLLELPADSQQSTLPRSSQPQLPAGPHEPVPTAPAARSPLPLILALLLVLLAGGAAAYVFLLRPTEPPAATPGSGAAAGTAQAIAEQEQTAARQKREYETNMAAGKKLFRDGDYIRALNKFQEASSLDPKNPGPFQWMGEVNRGRGNLSQARLDFEKYLKLSEPDLTPTVLEARLTALLGSSAATKEEPIKSGGDSGGRKPAGGTRPPRPTGDPGGKPAIDTKFE